MTTGIIKSFNPKTGNGYITADETDDDFAFDTDAIEDYDEAHPPYEGQHVTFQLVGGMAGLIVKRVFLLASRSEIKDEDLEGDTPAE